jgi:hypothetical protein
VAPRARRRSAAKTKPFGPSKSLLSIFLIPIAVIAVFLLWASLAESKEEGI